MISHSKPCTFSSNAPSSVLGLLQFAVLAVAFQLEQHLTPWWRQEFNNIRWMLQETAIPLDVDDGILDANVSTGDFFQRCRSGTPGTATCQHACNFSTSFHLKGRQAVESRSLASPFPGQLLPLCGPFEGWKPCRCEHFDCWMLWVPTLLSKKLGNEDFLVTPAASCQQESWNGNSRCLISSDLSAGAISAAGWIQTGAAHSRGAISGGWELMWQRDEYGSSTMVPYNYQIYHGTHIQLPHIQFKWLECVVSWVIRGVQRRGLGFHFRRTPWSWWHMIPGNCISYRVCDSTQENRQGNCLNSGGSWQVIKIFNIFQPNLTTIWKTDQHCNCTLPENHVELTWTDNESWRIM